MSIPYGCTIRPECAKTFTTFTQWWLHEAAEHEDMVDIWHCMSDFSPRTCPVACYTKEDFETHRGLQQHGVHPPYPDIDPDDYCLGPAVGKRFWCGFCKKVIEVPTGE